MDPRHVSLELKILNQILDLINIYREESLDYLVSQPALQSELKDICSLIYACAHQPIDSDALLAKRNFLSIDPIPLPLLNYDVVLNKKEFKNTIVQIRILATKYHQTDPFFHRLLVILK